MNSVESEKKLKSIFIKTANDLSSLYTESINCQKQVHSEGYSKGIWDTVQFILKDKTPPLEYRPLLLFLKERLENENCDHRILHVKFQKSSLDESIFGVKSEDDLFHQSINKLWTSWLNKDDKSVQLNKLHQYPMAEIYEDGSVKLEKYIDKHEFCDERPKVKFSYTKEEGILFSQDYISQKDILTFLNGQLNSFKVILI